MTWADDKYDGCDNETCQECRSELVERENGQSGEKFFGCINYPDCKYTEPTLEKIEEIVEEAQRHIFNDRDQEDNY